MKKCRICSYNLEKIINFGKIALVGNFPRKKTQPKKYKISLNFCKKCKHVQISEALNPALLFKNYLWETSISNSNFTLMKNLLKKIKKLGISKKSKVLEIASNDGSFIQVLKKKFNPFIIGIDPAKNLVRKANKNKLFTINNYFNYKVSKFLRKKYQKFNFIFARNVIAHLKNPNEVFKGVEYLLLNDGVGDFLAITVGEIVFGIFEVTVPPDAFFNSFIGVGVGALFVVSAILPFIDEFISMHGWLCLSRSQQAA